MARPDYVPRTHSGFDSWQRNINNSVTINAATWGIDPAKVAELNNKSNQFEGYYAKIENRNTRTLEQVAAFNQFRIEYTTFLRQLVQGSLVNNDLISYAEKIGMGLNPRTGARPERPKITSMPVIEIAGMGGGSMEFICIDSADGRIKRPSNADGVELHIEVTMSKVTDKETGEVVTVKDTVNFRSSKTRVSHKFTEAQRGKPFSVKGMWYNNTDPAKNGDYGNVVSSYVG
jgi:hypothetical protein